MSGFLVRVGAAIAMATLFATSAYADTCADLMRQAARGGGQESAALSRQLAALQRLERQRKCSGKSRGLFFDPCTEIAARKADVQRKMAKTQGGSARAQLAALGCTGERRKRVEAASRGPGGPYIGSHAMLFCVRKDDGYFFPVPGSQFLDSGDYKDVVDQCRYICRGSETAVYRLGDPSQESEEMLSVETGQSYKDLPTAFAYRDSVDFQGCNFQNYYRRVEEARARTVTPSNMDNALIPLPPSKPEVADAPLAPLAFTGEELPPAVDMPTDRTVRVVGPNFFPNDARD
jgi:hypothetical protein